VGKSESILKLAADVGQSRLSVGEQLQQHP